MRSSRAAKGTTSKFFDNAASSIPPRRSTRSSTRLASFAYNNGESSAPASLADIKPVKSEDEDTDIIGFGADIEDAVITRSHISPPPTAGARKPTARKRKRATTTAPVEAPRPPPPIPSSRRTRNSAATAQQDFHVTPNTGPLGPVDEEKDVKTTIPLTIDPDAFNSPNPNPAKSRAPRKLPARKTTNPSTGETSVQPPTNWEEMYRLVKEMRISGPAAHAAVDTMGCERLATRDASPRERRFHTLVALMLSSQTKDTVNAEAMARLKTELPPWREGAEPGLTLENMLAVEPEVLNELIGKVGFHNNKTKYLKQAAIILRDQHNSDIPTTLEGLMSLPGVGPKMAHLCMGAEHGWNKVTGIGVDVHVHRITNLWGWQSPPSKNPEETRLALESWLPRDKWKEINWLLVGFGQKVCLPVGRRCGDCTVGLKGLCKAADRKKVLEGRLKVEREETRVKGEPVVKREPLEINVERFNYSPDRAGQTGNVVIPEEGRRGTSPIPTEVKKEVKEEDTGNHVIIPEMWNEELKPEEMWKAVPGEEKETPVKKTEDEDWSFMKVKKEDTGNHVIIPEMWNDRPTGGGL